MGVTGTRTSSAVTGMFEASMESLWPRTSAERLRLRLDYSLRITPQNVKLHGYHAVQNVWHNLLQQPMSFWIFL